MNYDKSQAQHEFTRWSENYDRCILQTLLFQPSHKAIIKRIEKRYDKTPISILDVGCGTGVFAARIRDALSNSKVWGIDLVRGMLDKGSERWRHHTGSVTPIQGDSERLPFADNSFDIVTCANSFHHYPHQHHAVAEMYRVLKPSGRIMMVDGFRDSPWGWFIYDVCVARVEGAVHHASAKRFRKLFDEAGFEAVIQAKHWGLAPFLLTEAVATKTQVRTQVRNVAGALA
jgi:ubiquinone/menaquinone biosynthesis C-methylase UbiE